MSNLNINETIKEEVIKDSDSSSVEKVPDIDPKVFEHDSDDDFVVKNTKKGIVGLNNQGNTCYLNAVIQVLSNMDHFRSYLFDGDFVSSLKPELDDSLFYQTYRIIKHLWETTSDDLTPKSFRKKFIEKENKFMGFNQQDSHEAMQFLLDNLHEETAHSIDLNVSLPPELNEFFNICDTFYSDDTKVKDKNVIKFIDENRDKALDYFAMKYYTKLSKNYSEVADLFQSIICNLTKCPDCNHLSYQFDNSYMISLGFPDLDDQLIIDSEMFKKFHAEKLEECKERLEKSETPESDKELILKLCVDAVKSKNIYKLSELIDYFQRPEQLDESNAWYCEGCEKKVCAHKQSKLYKHPKYLIFHFKRFKHMTHNGNTSIMKIKNLIGYDETINLRHLMVKNTDSTNYKLVGGINHMGEYNFGHFTCFAKNNNKWYNYNDDRVNEINCNGIPISPNAYMLIYERIEDSDLPSDSSNI